MNWVVDNLELIGQLALVHLATAVPPIVLSFVLSIPIGWAANRFAVHAQKSRRRSRSRLLI